MQRANATPLELLQRRGCVYHRHLRLEGEHKLWWVAAFLAQERDTIGSLACRRKAIGATVRDRGGHEQWHPLEPVQRAVVQQEESVDEEEPVGPWVERARRLRPAWTGEQQATLARALRHAPNDGAAVVMAQVMLGVAACGAERGEER